MSFLGGLGRFAQNAAAPLADTLTAHNIAGQTERARLRQQAAQLLMQQRQDSNDRINNDYKLAQTRSTNALADERSQPKSDYAGTRMSNTGDLFRVGKDGTIRPITMAGQQDRAASSPGVQITPSGPQPGPITGPGPAGAPIASTPPRELLQDTTPKFNKPLPPPRTPRPINQQHVTDPVTGKVTFFDPTNPPKDLSVSPRPIGGMTGGMGSGGIGGIARTSAAITGMETAHNQMVPFENSVKQGKANYNGLDYWEGLRGKMYDAKGVVNEAVHSAAFASLDKNNPDLANYLRSVETWALEDSQLSGKPSDFRTKLDAFISAIGPNAGTTHIDNTQHFRQTRLDALKKFQPAMEAMAGRVAGQGGRGAAPPNVAGSAQGADKPGNIDLGATPSSSHAQQLWDAAVKLHGKAKVLQEYGPRPDGEE